MKYFHKVNKFFSFCFYSFRLFLLFFFFFYKKQIMSDVKIQFPFEEKKEKNIWPETFFFLS